MSAHIHQKKDDKTAPIFLDLSKPAQPVKLPFLECSFTIEKRNECQRIEPVVYLGPGRCIYDN